MSEKESLPSRDRLRMGFAADDSLRWVSADVTESAREARRRRDLSPTAAVALGRALAGAAALQRLGQKAPSRLLLEFRGDGPLGPVVAEASADGDLRGTVDEPHVEMVFADGGPISVAEAVGRGKLLVRRTRDGQTWDSQVEIVSGEIGQDLAHFLAQSEQRRAAVLLGVLARPEGIAAAGGLIIEALPAASEDAIRRLEASIYGLGGISRRLEEGGLAAVEEAVLRDLEPRLLEESDLRYHCSCSLEGLRERLTTLPAEQRQSLADATGRIVAECSYCGRTYRYRSEDLELQ